MLVRTLLLGTTLAAGSLAAGPAAAVPVLTSSFAAWQAAVGQGHVVTTANTGRGSKPGYTWSLAKPD